MFYPDLEEIFFIAITYLIISPVIIVVIFWRVKKLEKRIDVLLRRIQIPELSNQPTKAAEVLPATSSVENNDMTAQIPIERAKPEDLSSTEPSAIVTWLKQDTLVKIGALLLVFAFVWFVSYAFANNWIGPVGRIFLGLLFGAGVILVGVLRIRSHLNTGSIFAVAGSTIIIVTVTSAQYIYEMFIPKVALGIIFLVVLFITFLSLQYERSQLAYAGLLTALTAPFLINSQTGDSVQLMFYLLLVIAGTLFVVWRLRAEKITLVALGGVVAYTTVAYGLDPVVALLFSFVFTGIFFITNIISLIRRYTEWVSPTHIITAVLTGVYLIGSILNTSPEEWQSTYLLLWALIFAYGSYQTYLRTLNKIPFYIYVGVSSLLLGIATMVELSEAIETIAITLEVLLVIILFSRMKVSVRAFNLTVVLLSIPGLYTLEHIDRYDSWRYLVNPGSLFNQDFFAVLVFIIALVVAGWERNRLVGVRASQTSLKLDFGQKLLYGLASLVGSILFWLVLHNMLPEMVATMSAMIIFSLIGLALYIKGNNQDNGGIKKVGIIVLGIVVGRLLLIDVWDLALTGRIITFLIIGLLFMATAFLPKLKSTVRDVDN